MSLEEHSREIKLHVQALIEEVEKDNHVSDEELQTILALEQEIADKISDLLARYGLEVGDERID